ncbi:hypothetical protein ACFQS7_28120 [Dankookia sp. GCM10030260]
MPDTRPLLADDHLAIRLRLDELERERRITREQIETEALRAAYVRGQAR